MSYEELNDKYDDSLLRYGRIHFNWTFTEKDLVENDILLDKSESLCIRMTMERFQPRTFPLPWGESF